MRGERDALSAEKVALAEEKESIFASLTEAQSLLVSMTSEKERLSSEMAEAQNLLDSMASKLEVARESARRKTDQIEEEYRVEVMPKTMHKDLCLGSRCLGSKMGTASRRARMRARPSSNAFDSI